MAATMQQQAVVCSDNAVDGDSAVVSWPGYGIMFFWQLGVLQYLEQNFDLARCTFVGSSAGSMLSVLAACDVGAQDSLDLAHQLCIQHGVFERPLGLMGVWGAIVREWLDMLLPEDAADRCSGRVRIVITTLPLMQREVVTSFKDRDDLIDCCLASSHVPFLMDWQPAALCRGRRCVDGSMLYILTGRCSGLRPLAHLSKLLLFDPFHDRQLLKGWNVLRCVLLCGKEGAQQLLNQGFSHAAALDKAGALRILSPHRRQVGVMLAEPIACEDGGDVCRAGNDTSGMRNQLGSSSSSGSRGDSYCGSGWGGDSTAAAAAAAGGVVGKGDAVRVITSSDSVCSNSSSADGFCVDAVAVIAEGPGASKAC